MISHANIVATLRGYQEAFPQDETDERMAFLPLCHIAERVGGEYHGLYAGRGAEFRREPRHGARERARDLADDLHRGAARLGEVLFRRADPAEGVEPLQQWAYSVAIGIGYKQRASCARRASRSRRAWRSRSGWRACWCSNNVRKVIGVHRARVLVTGAAPISPDLIRWYMALGLDMGEVWGQTESCGAVTANPRDRVKPGSIGPQMAHAEVKVSPEGELLMRGRRVFMGYLNQPEKTAETLKDGWLHTGDVGRVDEDGYFYITDRMKDIIITAGGKNMTPSEFENQLKFSPYITDAVVIGDKRPYLVALVMIDHENVESYAQDQAIPFSNYASLCRRPEIQELIQAELDKVNKLFARVEQVKKFRLIEQKLTAEDEELTPTMKLKRKLVNEKYRDLIESMYLKEAA